jgi:hypothetical protein
MGALDPRVTRALDELVPPRPGPDRWNAIVGAAGTTTRGRRLVAAVPVAAVALAAAFVALAWPFGSGPQGTILERAAAAIGDGPVIHVVTRSGVGGTLVDLETGERRLIDGEQEIWYDPTRGMTHIVSRFGGVVEHDELFQRRRAWSFEKGVIGLARDYRDGLRTGAVQVLEDGVVDGEPVHWLRVESSRNPDVVDRTVREVVQEVAVSQNTFEVIATRETLDGDLLPGGIDRVLEVETLPAGEGDFSGELQGSRPATSYIFRPLESVLPTPNEASAVLGRPALWAGPQTHGLELARIWTQVFEERRVPDELLRKEHGVTFFYGTLAVNESEPGRPIEPDVSRPYVRITQSLSARFGRDVAGYIPPEGSVLVAYGVMGAMQEDGVHLTIRASSEELLLAAARALEPVPAG